MNTINQNDTYAETTLKRPVAQRLRFLQETILKWYDTYAEGDCTYIDSQINIYIGVLSDFFR